MRILIFGLPGSGKTTLATELVKLLPNTLHLNADEIRTRYNDWDFSPEGRERQATRMRTLADEFLGQPKSQYVVADFVAPTKMLRDIYAADFTIWMNTIQAGRYEDTNKAWQAPDSTDYDVEITQFNNPADEAKYIMRLLYGYYI
jgi:adenylylsulfate kinase